ncbi:MAG: hypothetical protein ABFD49_05190 [Armatimonadota bacterium]|nr:hypothetical protein [bacterium]
MHKRYFIIILLLIATALSPAYAGRPKVTISRILREHKIRVVTTEKPESISKYTFRLGVRNEQYLATVNLLIEQSRLKNNDSLLFIIDRQKARRLIPEEKKLFPCPLDAIDSSEVILYAAKASGRNGWDILVSAPNEKWLNWELDRLCKSNLDSMLLQERGSILDSYKVKRLCVISNEGKQFAENWVSRQLKPGCDTIDWLFYPTDSDLNSIDTQMDRLYILNKSKLDDKTQIALESLPDNMREWLDSGENFSQWGAEKQSIKLDSGELCSISAIIAPYSRQLEMALGRHPSINAIPEALTTGNLTDLSKYQEMIVIARSGDRTDKISSSILDDMAGKITSVLTARTGFKCVSRQDLKELVYMALLHEKDGSLNTNDIVQIRNRADGARALAIVDLAALTADTSYSANTPRCCTAPLPGFSESEPSRPSEPDPDERKFGIFGAHKYDEVHGSRSNDPDYIEDHRRWEKEMHDYRRNHDNWERRRRDYENSRWDHDMDWEVSINSTQAARVSGNLRIYDIGELETESAGKVLFSCSFTGTGSRESTYWSDHVIVRGENNQPSTPSVPQTQEGILDETIISAALNNAGSTAVYDLLGKTIVPADKLTADGSVNAK